MKLNPVVSDERDAPPELTKHGVTSYRVRMLSVKHMAKIRDAAVMDLPSQVFERARAMEGLGTDAQKETQARRELAAQKAMHPSTGFHEPSVIAYGVVALNGENVTVEWWKREGLDALSPPAALFLADEVCRFTGLNEQPDARGED